MWRLSFPRERASICVSTAEYARDVPEPLAAHSRGKRDIYHSRLTLHTPCSFMTDAYRFMRYLSAALGARIREVYYAL